MSDFIPSDAAIVVGAPSANGQVALWSHPTQADSDAVRCLAAVPWSTPAWMYCRVATTSEKEWFCATLLQPGQLGWEILACCVCLDGSLDGGGALVTDSYVNVRMLDTAFTQLQSHPVNIPPPILPTITADLEDYPAAASWVSGGVDITGTPGGTPTSGALWTPASKSARKVIIKVNAKNVGMLHLTGRPIWDQNTAIADML